MSDAKAKAATAPAARRSGTVSLSADLWADIDRLAEAWSTTREHVLETAVMRFVDEECPILEGDAEDGSAYPSYRDPSPEGQALDRATEEAERAFDAFIKVGEDQADRGEVVSQAEMERWFADRVATRGRSAAAG
jgi:predicted transcriptional regulator